MRPGKVVYFEWPFMLSAAEVQLRLAERDEFLRRANLIPPRKHVDSRVVERPALPAKSEIANRKSQIEDAH